MNRLVQVEDSVGRLLECTLRVVDRRAIVRTEKHEAERERMVFIQHLSNGEKVSERFGHLFRVNLHEAVVHPVSNKRIFIRARAAVACGARLREFVFVVREHQILTTTVNIDSRSQHFFNHGAALDVPPRTTLAPRTRPRRFSGFRGLPQREIGGILFTLIDSHAFARAVVLLVSSRQRAVRGKRVHGEIHVSVRLICVPLGDQSFDESDDIIHALRRARFHRRTKASERRHVLVERLDEFICERLARLPALVRPLNNLIINVGKIPTVRHIVPETHELSIQHVKGDVHARVTDVRIIVHRDSAHVHLHPLPRRVSRNEQLLLTTHRVQEPELG